MGKEKIFACDFETTVYEGQDFTEVWAAACVELFTENVKVFKSIDEQFDFLAQQKNGAIAYYHNLRFDGAFWLDWLIRVKGFKQAQVTTEEGKIKWMRDKDMPTNSFKYSISDMGRWYTVVIKLHNRKIVLRDSLKLMPFTLRQIGESFKTKHKKLDMDYEGFRYSGCEITESEMQYIKNDVLVLKEALEIMYNEGHTRLTIGSCCLHEYKNILKKNTAYSYEEFFPDIYEYQTEIKEFENAGEYIRKSYKGGWCYLAKGCENKIFNSGLTIDVNSLYPSVMHSMSGNRYPVGVPHFWKGNFIPDEALSDERYFFVRFKTRFYLKPAHLPFLQIKDSLLYKSTLSLETSDIYIPKTGEFKTHIYDLTGIRHDARPTITMTCTDFKLFAEHYELTEFEILDGAWFYTEIGIFDQYIDKYKEIKIRSKGAKRTLAKLFLNNLYGKMASSKDSTFKVAEMDEENDCLKYRDAFEQDKKPGYIPVGSAITSYARNFTIRAAQQNYHPGSNGFIYADTDSIHCDLKPEKLVGVKLDPKEFCCWDLESVWDLGLFVRQKTYVERVVGNGEEPCAPYYNLKCAGMPDICKDLFLSTVSGEKLHKKLEEEFKDYLYKDGDRVKREITDFKKGFKVPGKLMPKRIHGGIVLKDTYYEIR